jgi:alcohol dehydrogenase (NADP+)
MSTSININIKKIPRVTLASGESIPAMGMGTFASDNYGADEVAKAVSGAIKCGYRFFDCAAVYRNEDKIGPVLEAALKSGEVKRKDLFITSKVWNDMHGQGDVLLSLAKTLRDLRLDYVDAYFVHWPFPHTHAFGAAPDSRDPNSRPFSTDEYIAVWRQMEKLQLMDLTRYLGVSNMTIPKLKAVLPKCKIKPAFIEMELHPSFQQPELFKYCVQKGIQPIAFSPLGSPKRPERDKTPDDVDDFSLPEVAAIAKEHGIHPALVCLKWAVQSGAIPIPFSVHEANYAANLRCLTEAPLAAADMKALKSADKNCRLIKGQVFLWKGAKGWEDLWDLKGEVVR